MTTEERLDRLTTIVESLAASVVAHDNQIEAHDRQIEALIKIAEKHDAQIAETRAAIADLGRQLQAYLTRIPPQ